MPVFNRLKAQSPEKVRKPSEQTDFETRVENVAKTKHAPWWLKMAVNMRFASANVDPFITTQIICLIALVVTICVCIILPFFKVIADVANKWAYIGSLGSLFIGMFIMDLQNRAVRNRVCEVSIDGKTYMFDNRKIDIYDGGEIIYRINSYGKPVLCKEEDNLQRWGKQLNLFVPRDVLTQFDSIMGRKAKAYPDCHLKDVYMEDVDAGLMYLPRKISETRLLKQVEALEEQLKVMFDLTEQFKNAAKKIATTHADFEGVILNDLIKKQTSLQEAFWGTGAKFRQLINDSLYQQRFSGYQTPYYNRYQESGGPNWRNVSPRQPEELPEDSSGSSEESEQQ